MENRNTTKEYVLLHFILVVLIIITVCTILKATPGYAHTVTPEYFHTLATDKSKPDLVPPLVTITGVPVELTTTEPFTVNVAFSEVVSGFTIEDIVLTNATASNLLSVDGQIYVFDCTPQGNGLITINIAAGVAQDGAGNGNVGAIPVSVLINDIVPPSVTILGVPVEVADNEVFQVTVQFSEEVLGFALEDVVLSNATGSNFIDVDGEVYIFDCTPDGNGLITIDVAANVAEDLAGNGNLLAATVSVVLLDIDIFAPVPVIKNAPTVVNNTDPFPITIQFNEDVSGFDESDLNLTNATSSNFQSVSASEYTVDITPVASGLITIIIPIGAATDLNGNPNLITASVTVTVDLPDLIPPTVTIKGAPITTGTLDPFPITVEFSEDVTGFDVDDISVAGGSAGDFMAQNGSVYTAAITPDGSSTMTIDIKGSVAHDMGGNGNIASVPVVVAYLDSQPPSVEVLNLPDTINNLNLLDAIVKFSEDVVGFAQEDVELGNSEIEAFIMAEPDTYEVHIRPLGTGDVTVRIEAGRVQDLLGNLNEALEPITIVYDDEAPQVEIKDAPLFIYNLNTFSAQIEFSESVSGFNSSDISLQNASLSSFIKVDDRRYDIDVTPLTEADVVINVEADVAQDAAGNRNVAAESVSVIYAGEKPQVTITGAPAATNNTEPIEVEIIFSEDVVGFEADDVLVQNGDKVSFSAVSGSTYQLEVKPHGTANLTLNIPEGVAADSDGNANVASQPVVIIYDDVAPGRPSASELITNNVKPTLSGSWLRESDANLTVEVDGKSFVLGSYEGLQSDNEGNWNLDLRSAAALHEGIYDVKVVVTDIAGNESVDDTQDELTIDTTPPAVPTIAQVAAVNGRPMISGTWDMVDAIHLELEVNDEVFALGQAANLSTDQEGNWFLELHSANPDGNYMIYAVNTDAASNSSSADSFQQLVVPLDSDGDSVLDVDEDINNDGIYENDDSDGDGIPNYLDTDDDNDNIATIDEDPEVKGYPGQNDSDGDGIANYLDEDDDNDLLLTRNEDQNQDGDPTNDDCDDDIVPNYLDTDRCGVVPQAGLSPNGDGTYDHWRIYGIEAYPDNEVYIYNRWGNKVFDVQGYDNLTRRWDGQHNGNLTLGSTTLPEGTYFYLIDLKDGRKPMNGYIVLN